MQIPTFTQLALAGLLASSAAAFQAPQGPTAVACRFAVRIPSWPEDITQLSKAGKFGEPLD